MNILGHRDNKLGARRDMEIYVFPGADNTFKIYEDDGDTTAYQNGKLAVTEMKLAYTPKKAVFEIGAVEGDAAQSVDERRWTLRFRGFAKTAVAKVFVDGVRINARREYDKETNTVSVIIPKQKTSSKVTVELTAKNLMHDNSDWRERAFDIILRSQVDYQTKADLWDAFTKLSDKKDIMKFVVDYRCSQNLAEALLEQITL